MNRRGALLDSSTVNITRTGSSILGFGDFRGKMPQKPEAKPPRLLPTKNIIGEDNHVTQRSMNEVGSKSQRILGNTNFLDKDESSVVRRNTNESNNRPQRPLGNTNFLDKDESSTLPQTSDFSNKPQFHDESELAHTQIGESSVISKNSAELFLNQTSEIAPKRKSLLFGDGPKTAASIVPRPPLTQPVPQVEANPIPKNFPDIPNTNPPSAPVMQKSIFAQDIPQVKKSQSVAVFAKPDENFQRIISSSIDVSLNNFKRSVLRDISNVFRPCDKGYDGLFEAFSADLYQKIDSAVKSISFYADDPRFVATKIAGNIEESRKEIRALFAESESANMSKRERKKEHLSDLNSALSDLLKNYKDMTSNVLSTFDKIQVDAAAKNEALQSQRRINDRKMRSYRLKRSDLEAYAARQMVELEQAKRIIKQTEETIDNDKVDDSKKDNEKLRNKIREEIEKITDSLNSNSFDDFEDVCNETAQKIADINSVIVNDFDDIEMTSQTALIKIRSAIYRNRQQASRQTSFVGRAPDDRKLFYTPVKQLSPI